jgi:chaperonin cofactor prefoldin
MEEEIEKTRKHFENLKKEMLATYEKLQRLEEEHREHQRRLREFEKSPEYAKMVQNVTVTTVNELKRKLVPKIESKKKELENLRRLRRGTTMQRKRAELSQRIDELEKSLKQEEDLYLQLSQELEIYKSQHGIDACLNCGERFVNGFCGDECQKEFIGDRWNKD